MNRRGFCFLRNQHEVGTQVNPLHYKGSLGTLYIVRFYLEPFLTPNTLQRVRWYLVSFYFEPLLTAFGYILRRYPKKPSGLSGTNPSQTSGASGMACSSSTLCAQNAHPGIPPGTSSHASDGCATVCLLARLSDRATDGKQRVFAFVGGSGS